jgi:hypothetical protein
MTDHDAHGAAFVAADWAASARRLPQTPPSPSETLLGLAALRVAFDTGLRLASLDTAARVDLPPVPAREEQLQRPR